MLRDIDGTCTIGWMPTIFVSPRKKALKGTPPRSNHQPFDPLHQPTTRMQPFTAFAIKPDHLRFETQEEKEVVILFVRQHIIMNLPWVLLTFVLAIAPTIVFPKLFALMRINFPLPSGYFFIGTVFWYLATFGFALANFISWFFNIYIVTNERIVDIDFYYLLYKKFSEAELTRIQDISYTTGGIVAAIFNFGDVMVETAGEAPNIIFERVPYPEKVVETIRALTEHEEGENV